MKKILSLVISAALLALIYWKIDLARLAGVFAASDLGWMLISLAMVIPLTLATAWRLQQLVPASASMTFLEANRLILVASVLNLVLPSKMGDIAKAWFMRDRGGIPGALAVALVIFEKACDMLALLLWCSGGLVYLLLFRGEAMTAFDPRAWSAPLGLSAPQWLQPWHTFSLCTVFVSGGFLLGVLLLGSRRFAQRFFVVASRFAPRVFTPRIEKFSAAWNAMHDYFWVSKARLARVAATSLFIWFLHLGQIWLFIVALKMSAPFFVTLALTPLAILAGLLPLTLAGIGTRDAALIVLYSPYFNAAAAAALGILCTARYLLPALAGLPFAAGYFQGRQAPQGRIPAAPQ